MTATTTLICPKCRGEMRAYERIGVLIDQCEDCRGIFLDRGELERLIDLQGHAEDHQEREHHRDEHHRDEHHDDDRHERDRHGQRRASRVSFLQDFLGGGE